MEPFYKQTFTLTDLHVDRFGRLKPSVLLYFAQEVAGKHAAMLGAGWEVLSQKHLFWAVIRHAVQITRLPVRGETVTVETWPMPTTRAAYPRSVIAYDETGCELFRTVSLWVLMRTVRQFSEMYSIFLSWMVRSSICPTIELNLNNLKNRCL